VICYGLTQIKILKVGDKIKEAFLILLAQIMFKCSAKNMTLISSAEHIKLLKKGMSFSLREHFLLSSQPPTTVVSLITLEL
jgi:hypothetical protein